MLRRFATLIGSLSISLWMLSAVFAQDATTAATGWPHVPVDPDLYRGPGYYLSISKILACWLLFLVWVRTSDWVNCDLQLNRLKVKQWNPIIVAPFAIAFLLVWFIPIFWLGYLLMVLAFAVPLGFYIFYYRNPKVADHEKVLTPAHIRFELSEKLKYVGIKIQAEKPLPQDMGGLALLARGAASDEDDQINVLKARQLPGYKSARDLLTDAIDYQSDAVLLEFSDSVAVRYLIDGVWHNHQPQERDAGEQVLAVLKTLCDIDPAATLPKQNGKFATQMDKSVIECELNCQAAGTNQRALVKFDVERAKLSTLDELGMRAKTIEQLKEQIMQDTGVILFSALPGGGLTTTVDVTINHVDRLLRDFVSVEDESKPEHAIESVDAKTYNGVAGETPATILPSVLRTKPDVVVCRNLTDVNTVTMLCKAAEERMILGAIGAKDAAEALLRVLVLKVPAATFAPAVRAVLHVKLIRKLCEECREAYPPPPELLKQLGIPAGKVESFYRLPTEEQDKVCGKCHGIGYRGRTGLFELLVVDDTTRKVLTTKPQLDLLRKAARQAGMQGHRENGVLLVARGVTSIEELQRVLKG